MIEPLPIDEHLPQLLAALDQRQRVVLTASTGAGKTTRVPWALANHPPLRGGQVVVLEPRRLAARLAAERVADEQGLILGKEVGYAVRFARRASADTRLIFVTEALLTRRLQQDPSLVGISAVVLDELHERNLHSDLALALVNALQHGQRPDLCWLAMSATLDGAEVAKRFDAGWLRCQGRMHPVTLEHLTQVSREPLDRQVAISVRQLLRDGVRGHLLVFLPSLAELRRTAARCRALAHDHQLAVHLLHGRLPRAQQDDAVRPSQRQKLILATNVAESSITIDGIEAVVDSGLANVASQQPYASLSRLRSEPISQASATQRAGRAGRTGPGRCLRLYTERDFNSRPAFDVPAIVRSDLCELSLTLTLSGQTPAALRWLTPPPEEAIASATQLLQRLGAIDEAQRPTQDAARLARLPLHPRHARALLEAAKLGVSDSAESTLALLTEQADLRQTRPGQRQRDSSLWQQLELLEGGAAEPRSVKRVERAAAQLRRQIRGLRVKQISQPQDDDGHTHALMVAMLRGFPDRVAKRVGRQAPKQGDALALALVDGGRAVMRELTSLGPDGFCLLLAAHQRPNQPALVHLAMPVTVDALLDAFADCIRDDEQLLFHPERQRVERISRMMLGGLVLDESHAPASAGAALVEPLLTAIQRQGHAAVLDVNAWERLRLRLATAIFAGDNDAADALLKKTLKQLCGECISFAELRQRNVLQTLQLSLDAEQRKRLRQWAPEHIQLGGGRKGGGRQLKVHYPSRAPAFVEGYVQDFYGVEQLPQIGGKRLVVKLCAPNRRPIQVTDDLAGFWQNHYPTLRKQLSRRYPKHHFPEHPQNAPPALLKRHLKGDGGHPVYNVFK